MKFKFTPLCCLAVFLLLATSPQIYATTLCASPDSDLDGDGWGWENDASCLVEPMEIRETPPVCELVESDPDGDGWGWENDASCTVEVDGYPTPGISISSATQVVVGAELSSALTSEQSIHWYAYDIVSSDLAFELTNSVLSAADFSIANLQDSGGENRANLDLFGFETQTDALCLSPGRYFLSIDAFFFESPARDAPYNVSLRQTNLRCVLPEFTIETDSFSDAFTTISGGYVYAGTHSDLIAVSHDGRPLWKIDNALDDFVTGITAADDNTVYAHSEREIVAISAAGELLWTYTISGDGFLDNVAVDSNGVYLVVNFNQVIGLDRDGQAQWVVPNASINGVNSIDTGDDGTLYLRSYNSVTVLRP